ncbi:hypothetical protein G4B88_022337 [Cannabis sativa]|uniref:F-box domain-containing protein n=1 Tax=Cannabis sativa TaxID=3483 RepID=A0A7J6HVB4_CANSA|nr:hypothetical protein G4B88_022337 [Cannabis sativa]
MIYFKRRKPIEARDKVSDLPTFILHRILSLLPKIDAARTCVLSKKWNCAWNSFPEFEFHEILFTKQRPNLTPEYLLKFHDFINIVNNSLYRFFHHHKPIFHNDKLIIQKFALSLNIPRVDCADSLVSTVNKWVKSVMDNGVRDLFLKISISGKPYYILPENTFQHGKSSINGGPSYSKFSFLQRLVLYSVYITEDIIRDITQNCSNIEFLGLYCCHGLESSLDISNLSKLKCLKVLGNREHLSRVNINAPNLTTFCLEYSYVHSNHQQRRCCEMSLNCPNLKSLRLAQCGITDRTLHSNLSRLPLLESLDINDCYLLHMIRISAPRLQNFCLSGSGNIESVGVNAPLLASIEYTSYNTNYKDPIIFFPNNEQHPTEVVYEIDRHNVSFKVEELQEVAIPPVVEIEDLVLKCSRSITSFANLIDGLLWSCYPKKVSICSDSIYQRNCILILRVLLERAITSECCVSLNRRCWRHDLKSVSMKISQRTNAEDEPRLHCWNQLPDTWPVLGDFDQIMARFYDLPPEILEEINLVLDTSFIKMPKLSNSSIKCSCSGIFNWENPKVVYSSYI